MSDMRNEKNFDKIMLLACRHIGDKVFFESQNNIVRMGISDTGALLQSGSMVPISNGSKVYYHAPYAWEVEKGRLPGSMPPVIALENWVRRKLGVPRSQQRKVAWAIAMGIKKYGIQPQPFLEEATLTLNNYRFKLQAVRAI
jgi:hypothetical protein